MPNMTKDGNEMFFHPIDLMGALEDGWKSADEESKHILSGGQIVDKGVEGLGQPEDEHESASAPMAPEGATLGGGTLMEPEEGTDLVKNAKDAEEETASAFKAAEAESAKAAKAAEKSEKNKDKSGKSSKKKD